MTHLVDGELTAIPDCPADPLELGFREKVRPAVAVLERTNNAGAHQECEVGLAGSRERDDVRGEIRDGRRHGALLEDVEWIEGALHVQSSHIVRHLSPAANDLTEGMGSTSPLPHLFPSRLWLSKPGVNTAGSLGLLVDAAGTSAVDPIREVSELARGSAHVTVGMGWVAPSPMSSQPPDHRYGMDRPVSPEMPAGMGSAAGEIGVLPPKRAGPLTAPIAPVTVAAVIHRSEPAAEPIGQGIPYRRSCGPIPAVTRSHTRGHVCRSPL